MIYLPVEVQNTSNRMAVTERQRSPLLQLSRNKKMINVSTVNVERE